MEWAFSVEKRQNGGRLNQRALRVPLGSFQNVLRKDLEADLERTQNYCVELFALYLRRMIVEIQFSMKLLACPGAAEQMPSHGPTGKLQHVAILSLYVKGLSSQERNILNVDRPLK